MKFITLWATIIVSLSSTAVFASEEKTTSILFDNSSVSINRLMVGCGMEVAKITKVTGEKITVSVTNRTTKETREIVVTADEKTAIKIDGKDSKVADLKEGLFVKIDVASNKAKTIIASTKEPTSRPSR